MIELADTNPAVDVAPAEYFRLLGYPRGRVPEGRAAELAAWARDWYASNGRPWIYAREAEAFDAAGDSIAIAGEPFHSARLQQMIERAGAHTVILAAVSAGSEAEDAAQELWREEKPDEYFFLEMFAAAVVEHLITATGARLCSRAEERGMAVLPHYSPGYSEWDIAEQPRLLAVVKQHPLPGCLESLTSGALRPKKSLLAVFGLTRHIDRVQRLTELQPCENCSFTPCAYRRAPFRGDRPARYSVNLKALRRWAAERLRLEPRPGGHTLATFRYDGTTCCNMGRPLAFDYKVLLGPQEHGYPICEQSCAPAPGDNGYTAMCEYIANPEAVMSAIAREKPLCGKLDDILSWTRPATPSGCYCDAAARDHKWGLVLETIHYKLNENA
jgi:hypothetical protein